MFNSDSENKNIVTGYFGKLPGFPDFIKYNSAGKEIIVIDTWLQEGLALAKLKIKNDWKSYYNSLNKMNFIFPFTGTDNITIGNISSSNDKSGRSYPFIMFSLFNKNSITELSNYLIPYAFKEIFSGMNKILDENKMAVDTAHIKSGANNLIMQDIIPAYIASDYKKFLSSTKLLSVFELEGDDKISLNYLFEKLIIVYDHFVSITYKRNPDQSDDFISTCFCVQLLQIVFKSINSTPIVFWYMLDDNSGFLFLSFTKPTPKDFIDLLLSNRISETSNENIAMENQTGKSLVRDNSTINGSITLQEFLDSVKTYLN